MKTLLAALTAAALIVPRAAFAAIGCTLSSPAQDLKYLFPEMTSYKEELKEFTRMKDGRELFDSLQARLASDLDPIYETYETPYTVYSVYKGSERIGIVHGVNVPGKGGVIQVFAWTDPKTAAIKRFFFQRLESPAARALRDKAFRAQFEGLTLADFYKHDYYAAAAPGSPNDKVGALKPPVIALGGKPDYDAALRGVRKNLILLDIFVYGRRFEPFFQKAQAAKAGGKP
jgi:hypothetical protein